MRNNLSSMSKDISSKNHSHGTQTQLTEANKRSSSSSIWRDKHNVVISVPQFPFSLKELQMIESSFSNKLELLPLITLYSTSAFKLKLKYI